MINVKRKGSKPLFSKQSKKNDSGDNDSGDNCETNIESPVPSDGGVEETIASKKEREDNVEEVKNGAINVDEDIGVLDKEKEENAKEELKNGEANVEETFIVFDKQEEENAREVVKSGENIVVSKNEKEENAKEQVKNGENVEGNPKGKKFKLRRGKKRARKGSKVVASKDVDTSGSSDKRKSKRVESMGMIFMCSSKTKKDCYHYKVLGLPASKKDAVCKVYKGMRLFLFDFDLRLMYGIYKAAGPGGYNIEPKAFNSAFPSQVRFTVLEDCLPLPEEKFKKVIKENYFSRNKFDCQLTSEQVKNLCKLFKVANRNTKPKATPKPSQSRRSRRPEAQKFEEGRPVQGRPVRKRVRDAVRRPLERDLLYREDPIKYQREAYQGAPAVPPDRDVLIRDDPVLYHRETYKSQVPPGRSLRLPQPASHRIPPPHAYERSLGMADSYRQEPLVSYRQEPLVEHYNRWGDTHAYEVERYDPYVTYYREAPLPQDPIYSLRINSTVPPQEYRPPVGPPPEYYPPMRSTVEYRRPVAPATEYVPPAGPLAEYLPHSSGEYYSHRASYRY